MFQMKVEEIMRLNAQLLELPDDYSSRYKFSKSETLTSNFGPQGYYSKIKKNLQNFRNNVSFERVGIMRENAQAPRVA